MMHPAMLPALVQLHICPWYLWLAYPGCMPCCTQCTGAAACCLQMYHTSSQAAAPLPAVLDPEARLDVPLTYLSSVRLCCLSSCQGC